ncbi:FtsK/SpoIIIE domain-containing protein [Paenisporosarcina sp. NPDC076898]|uniref:FtsK/SpoIIIE domain-containing protein n=1 Tax=unclassified Paenisporosarcina TaxID=2642018 RepID=UPI003CFFE7DF
MTLRIYNEPLAKEVAFKSGERWQVPVGITRGLNEFRYHDFERIPHLVLGGATRYGKSNFINSMITSLLQSQPDYVKLFLIDLKGGIELCDYENIKQTVSIAYEPSEALETLQAAYDLMRENQGKVRSLGKKNVQEAGIKERCFVIIDEVGELNPAEATNKEDKALKIQCQTLMSQIARLGAGLGFRQILATQYPTGDVIPRQCKQNSDAKLSFRVQSATASRVVLDETGAEDLPQIVGRAIYQTAAGREILQTPLITSDIIQTTLAPYIVKKEVPTVEKAIEQPRRTDTVTFETL